MARILIIEDDPTDRDLIRRTLGDRFDQHYTCTLAEGCAYMVRDEPDAVLLDVRLPDTRNDDDALRAIKAVKKRAAIIILSGAVTPEKSEAWIRGNASGCLSKHLMQSRLLHEIANGISNERVSQKVDKTTERLIN